MYQVMRRHRDRQGLVQLWSNNHELYRGRIFKRKSKYAQVFANLVFKTVNTFKANLTDNKPRASIMPNGNTDDRIADAWQARYDMWWEKTRQQHSLQQSVGRSELYGCQTDMMVFNPDIESGLGDVQTIRCDVYGTLFWPGCQDIQEQPLMAYAEAMELGKIYDRWPKAEGKVTADPEYSEMLGEARTFVRATKTRNLRPLGTPTGFYVPEEDDRAIQPGRGMQRALVVQIWCRDESTHHAHPESGERMESADPITEPLLDDAGNQIGARIVRPVEKSTCPGGIRCIIVTNKGNLVLSDLPNPSINPNLPDEVASQTYLWDKFPFVKRCSYSDDISEYGLSIVEQIEPLVFELCKKLTQYGVHLDTQCRTPLILPKNSGVKRDEVNNLPARVWEPNPGAAQLIRFLQVPAASAEVINYIELLIRLLDMVTGVTDVSEGRKPGGVQSGVAIASLQEKAQVIYREKIRNLDISLEEQGRMFISLGQNWYTEEQLLKYSGKSGEEEMISFRGPDFVGELSFKIEAGSSLPRDRASRINTFMELAKAGRITNLTLLKELNVPNADEEASRLEAGPVGLGVQKLAASKLFDDQTLQAVEQILMMSDNEFSKQFSGQAGG